MDRVKLSEQIRQAIEKSGLSGYRIAKETGISQSMISVFMSGKGMLSMKFLDRVADLIGLNITIDRNGSGADQRAGQQGGGRHGADGGMSSGDPPPPRLNAVEIGPAVRQTGGDASLVEAHERR